MEGSGTPFGTRMQLYCEVGFLLKISEDGEITGTQDDFDPYTHLELSSGGDIGEVKIQGIQSQLYVCFDKSGKLYGENESENSGSTFKEEFAGSYNSYESLEYPGWFIGINKTGISKKGQKTQSAKKSTKFLPRRI